MACKYSSARWAALSFALLYHEDDTREVAKESVEGGNGGNQRYELKRGNAVGVTRAWQKGKCGCHQYGVPLRWRYESQRGSAVRASRLGITFRMN
eukprot:5838149-Pleurochrysis_carterae.AAC.3